MSAMRKDGAARYGFQQQSGTMSPFPRSAPRPQHGQKADPLVLDLPDHRVREPRPGH